MAEPIPVTPGSGTAAFHLLAKPTGATCNLDCEYCFFLSKEMLYPGSRFRMADDLLDQYIRQLIEAQRVPHVTVAWQGGEPTMMGVDFFRRSVAYVERYRRPGMTVDYTIQTNGTLIDDELAGFFKEHHFLVGISIDGPRSMHDAFRVDRGGAPTFDRVMRGLERLRAHEVDYNVLTTLHRANADHPVEVYRFLRDEVGARFMQFIPIIERLPAPTIDVPLAELGLSPGLAQRAPWTSWRDRPLYRQEGALVTDRSVTAEQYGSFLSAVFDEWVRRDIGEVYVQMFDVALANWYGEPPSLCIHSETCGTALAMEHNGDMYSCDHFVEDAYKLGNITETPMADLVASEQQRSFGLAKRDTLPRFCRDCDVRFACHGGCPKDRFIETPDGEPGLNYLCAGYQAFFRHVDKPMRMMSELLRRNRAPSELVAWYATEDERVRAAAAKSGRNDPCPCGSGRKVKNCHGSAA
ncbi:MAG: anaerobic sulfatase maturase [Chloroflexota bacterium]|nr:anaerobic sulfatase maturase [Chloroflexota bacterium]